MKTNVGLPIATFLLCSFKSAYHPFRESSVQPKVKMNIWALSDELNDLFLGTVSLLTERFL